MENITLVYGAMKSGKSAYLIDLYNNLREAGKAIDVFEPEENTRDNGFLKSRKYPQIIKAKTYKDRLISNADVVILDELNLVNISKIEQLKKDCLELKRQRKQVYIACLDRMADNRKFKQYEVIQDIIDVKKHIKGRCEICGKPSTRTKLIRDKRATDYIEGIYNKYVACCKEHWEPIKTMDILL